MKDKLLQIRVDADFLSKLEYLQKINGYKTIAETVRKLVEKEFRKENKTCKWIAYEIGIKTGGKPYYSDWRCSECLFEIDDVMYKYCPNCGAKRLSN